MADQVSERDFLERLKELFGVSRICYYGVGLDDILESPFEPHEIWYFDKKTKYLFEHRVGRCFAGNYSGIPFRSGSFDALFYKDNEANLKQTLEMIRTLRQGGIVVCVDVCDEDLESKDLAKAQESLGIKAVELPYQSKNYKLFQKL